MWHRRKLAALCAAIAVLAILDVLKPPAPPTVVLLTANHDLPAGVRLHADDVSGVRYPRSLAPDGALTQLGDIVGRSPSAGFPRGAPITRVGLAGDGWSAEDTGRTAVAVRLQDPAVADLLVPGQRVRLLAIDPRTPGRAETLVDAAVVLAVPTPDARASSTNGRIAVFEVPTKLAEIVASSAVSRYLTVTWGH